MFGIRTGHALPVDDVHPRAVGAERDVVRLVGRRDQRAHLVRLSARQRDDGDRVCSAVDGVERVAVGRQRDRRRSRAGVLPVAGQHAGRGARVDSGDDVVRRRVDDRDLIRVVLGDVEPRLRGVERHPERVAVELDPFNQLSLRRRRHVDDDDLAVAVR